jgi:hypothetical protein
MAKRKHNSCLYCFKRCLWGEWTCKVCSARNKQAIAEPINTKQEVAKLGTIEQQQYSGARPIAKGRVGPFRGFSDAVK